MTLPAGVPSPELCARILEATRRREEEWAALVTAMARIETPTTEPGSQDPLQALLAELFEEVGLPARRVAGRESGGILLAGVAPEDGPPGQLLIGHSDTVWPVGTIARMPVERDGSVLRGPGVFDMKGGLAHMVVALRVLRELGLEPSVPPLVFVNSDEETGSHESTDELVRLAEGAERAFVLEPAAGPEGKLKTARRGTGKFSIRAVGKGAHAGLDPEKGVSAIEELARVTRTLHAMKDPARGIYVNVGVFRGGVRANVVAPEAWIEVDVRVDALADGERLEERIRGIRPEVPGCVLEIEGGLEKPPLERTPRNRSLWAAARAVAESMELPLAETRVGGGSDGNTTSLHIATLDGMGCVGDGAHADHEFVDVPQSVERCAFLAAMLLLPPAGEGGAA